MYNIQLTSDIMYANGTEVDIGSLTELPEILTYVRKENESLTLVNHGTMVYSIYCFNKYTSYYKSLLLDIGFIAKTQCVKFGCNKCGRSSMDIFPIVGEYMNETYGHNYPSDFVAIYRLAKMADPLVASILDKNNLISYIEPPVHCNSILKFAKGENFRMMLENYSGTYRIDVNKCNIYANGVMVKIDTLTELPEALVFINNTFESFTLVNTYINGIVVTYGIHCLSSANNSKIDIEYLTSEDGRYEDGDIESVITLYHIIGNYMLDTHDNYPSNLDAIYRLVRMANYILGLLFDQDTLVSRISGSLVKRASH